MNPEITLQTETSEQMIASANAEYALLRETLVCNSNGEVNPLQIGLILSSAQRLVAAEDAVNRRSIDRVIRNATVLRDASMVGNGLYGAHFWFANERDELSYAKQNLVRELNTDPSNVDLIAQYHKICQEHDAFSASEEYLGKRIVAGDADMDAAKQPIIEHLPRTWVNQSLDYPEAVINDDSIAHINKLSAQLTEGSLENQND